MPIAEYPFVRRTDESPPRPMLHLRISNPATRRHVDALGLIDTGADECALPARFAELLGHNLQAGKAQKIRTASGSTTAYSHRCTIDIFDTHALCEGREQVVHTLENTPIDFLPKLGPVLLGVRSFLSGFVLAIDYPRRVFSIRRP